MADPLVLDAAVVDRFSKPLKDLRDRVKDLRPSENLNKVARQFEDLRKKVEAATAAIRDGAGGLASGAGLAGLGVGALSAAGAMAALSASVRSFADNTVRIRNFTNDTGIAVKTLKELQQVAAGLSINPDAIAPGLAFASHNAEAMRRGMGNYSEIANLKGGASIANDLKNTKSNDEVVEKELGYLGKQRSAEARRTLSRLFFGSEDFAEFGAQGKAALDKRRADADKFIFQPSAEDQKKAEAFEDAISKISAAFEKMSNAIGSTLAPDLTAAAEGLAKFTDAHLGDVKDFFEKVTAALKTEDWAADLKGVESFFTSIKDFAKWIASEKDTLNKIAAPLNAANDAAKNAGKLTHDAVTAPNITPYTDYSKTLPDPRKDPRASPDANKGVRELFMGDDDDSGPVKKMAYRPGAGGLAARSAIVGIRDTVDVIAAGVEKGMRAVMQNPPATGGGDTGIGGGGFQNASYEPGGRSRFGGGGRGGSVAAESIMAVHAKGSLAKNQKLAYDAAIAGGLSPAAARAFVANTSGEALSDPGNVHWDGQHYAHGIVQWDDTRSARIKKQFGQYPQQMGVADQTKAAIWEIKKYYPEVWKALQGGGSAESMIDTLVRKYEMPGNKNKAIAQRLAFLKGLAKSFQGGQEDKPDRPSTADAAAKRSAAVTGAQGPHGKVSVEVTSKDHPVRAKTDDSPIFKELKINRGPRLEI